MWRDTLAKQQEGQADEFVKRKVVYKGMEREVIFVSVNKTKKVFEITGVEEAPIISDNTSLNSGDFPFTYHTHPVV